MRIYALYIKEERTLHPQNQFSLPDDTALFQKCLENQDGKEHQEAMEKEAQKNVVREQSDLKEPCLRAI